MGKRKTPDDDSDGYVDSCTSDAECCNTPTNTVTTKRKTSTARGRVRTGQTTATKKRKTVSVGKESVGVFDSVKHATALHKLQNIEPIRLALLNWYEMVHTLRGMPWRKPFDPNLGDGRSQRAYEIWVSEVMLQQTQVSTVIPYYNNWMTKFPTIQALAASTVDNVNAVWKGLGYYSRASRLLEGAKKVVLEYDGKLPSNAKDMQAKIPGVGRYTAGAICSIAYGERTPVVDGNIHRLLSRLLALYANPKAKSTLDVLWKAAETIVEKNVSSPSERQTDQISMAVTQYAGDINQALIELGSTVCKDRDPKCEACPLSQWCKAYSGGSSALGVQDIEDLCTICDPVPRDHNVTLYPMKAEKKKLRDELDIVNVIEWRSTLRSKERLFLLSRRPEQGLLAGMYEFPSVSDVSKTLTRTQVNEQSREFLSTILGPTKSCSWECSIPNPSKYHLVDIQAVGDVPHVFSHVRKVYRIQWILLHGNDLPPTIPLMKDPLLYAVSSTTTHAMSSSDLIDKMWTPITTVQDQNISTGVDKIWKMFLKFSKN